MSASSSVPLIGVICAEISRCANIHEWVFAQQNPFCQIPADNLPWSISKTGFAISTICQCCLYSEQHPHLCSTAAHLESYSEQMQSEVSPCSILKLCKCVQIYISTIFITHQLCLSADNAVWETWAVVIWKFYFLLSVSNCACHKQQALLQAEKSHWVNILL